MLGLCGLAPMVPSLFFCWLDAWGGLLEKPESAGIALSRSILLLRASPWWWLYVERQRAVDAQPGAKQAKRVVHFQVKHSQQPGRSSVRVVAHQAGRQAPRGPFSFLLLSIARSAPWPVKNARFLEVDFSVRFLGFLSAAKRTAGFSR